MDFAEILTYTVLYNSHVFSPWFSQTLINKHRILVTVSKAQIVHLVAQYYHQLGIHISSAIAETSRYDRSLIV